MRLFNCAETSEVESLLREHYRWWTVRTWGHRSDFGLKFGPATIGVYFWGWRPNVYVSFMGRWVADTLWVG